MGCSALLKVFVVIVNILFMVIGLAIFATGLFIRFGASTINGYADTAKDAIEKSVADSGLTAIDLSGLDITELLFAAYMSLIFVGLLIMAVSLLGCCGSCCSIKCMLILYVIICCVLLVGEVIVLGILYGSPDTIHDSIKTTLKEDVKSNYAGLNGGELLSIGWNIIMRTFKCCGVDSYDDFTGAPNWTIDYTTNTPAVTLKTPLACCKELPSSQDFTCAGATASSTNNYLTTGCYSSIWDDTLGKMMPLVISALAVVCVLQLLLIIFALVLLCSGGNNKKNKVRPAEKQSYKPQKAGRIPHKKIETLNF